MNVNFIDRSITIWELFTNIFYPLFVSFNQLKLILPNRPQLGNSIRMVFGRWKLTHESAPSNNLFLYHNNKKTIFAFKCFDKRHGYALGLPRGTMVVPRNRFHARQIWCFYFFANDVPVLSCVESSHIPACRKSGSTFVVRDYQASL